MLVTLDHTATGVALILVDAKAENQIAVAAGRERGAHRRARPRPRSTGSTRTQGDVVIVTHEIPTAAAREALRIGTEGGAWTVLNPAPADGIDRTMLSLADVVTPNRGELARLGGRGLAPVRPPDLGQRGPDPGREDPARDDVGGPGCRARPSSCRWARRVRSSCANDGKPVDIKAPKVKAVDATGAGDALNGSLAAALASGLDLETAARRAVVAASHLGDPGRGAGGDGDRRRAGRGARRAVGRRAVAEADAAAPPPAADAGTARAG